MLRLVTHFSRWIDNVYRQFFGISLIRFSQITPNIFLGGQFSKRGFYTLKNRGFTGIVSLRAKVEEGQLLRDGVHILQLKVKDKTAPEMQQIKKGITFIQDQLKQNGKVYIHCAVGEGRSVTFLTAYLMSIGFSTNQALQKIKHTRMFIRPTNEQLNKLRNLKNFLQGRIKNNSD